MEYGFIVGYPGIVSAFRKDFTNGCDDLYGRGNWGFLPDATDEVGNLILGVKKKKQFSITRIKDGIKKCYPVPMDASLYFATGNDGKFNTSRQSLKDLVGLVQVPFETSEDSHSVEEVAKYKAKVAGSVLCRPVIADDSGFGIPNHDEWPGNRVGRVLKEHGLRYFLDLAKDYPLKSYWIMSVAYLNPLMKEPVVFTVKVWGTLLGEARGPETLPPWAKSQLYRAFILDGDDKSLAELTEAEHDARARNEHWKGLKDYLTANSSVRLRLHDAFLELLRF